MSSLSGLLRMLGILTLLIVIPATRADVKVSALFSDHMVLQRDMPVPIWGWGDIEEEVKVTFAGQTKTTHVDRTGRWSVKLDKLTAGGPHTLTVQGGNLITIKDVLVGEVWLASGQSNMAMAVQRCNEFEKEKAAANLPRIRMFTVTSGPATKPQTQCEGKWAVCSPETVGTFSGTAYFFGRELHKQLDVPIGIVNSSVGGAAIEAWTSDEAQKNIKELAPMFERWTKSAKDYDPAKAKEQYEKALTAWKEAAKKAKDDGKPAPRRPQAPVHPDENRNHPANLFNGKIAPLVPFAIRGAIWYQGEANSRNDIAHLYETQLALLIKDWRSRWRQGEFPFAWVQLPNFLGNGRNWPVMREGMLRTLKVPNTGMAVTIDIGDPKDIHPTNKQDVGKRLALWALAKVYEKKIVWSGPMPAKHTVEEGQGRVTFHHAGDGLAAKGGELKGFVISGGDGKWHPAVARIEGKNIVLVSSPDVKNPTAVRYAWENNPTCNLYNSAGLPASPFRTDTGKE